MKFLFDDMTDRETEEHLANIGDAAEEALPDDLYGFALVVLTKGKQCHVYSKGLTPYALRAVGEIMGDLDARQGTTPTNN